MVYGLVIHGVEGRLFFSLFYTPEGNDGRKKTRQQMVMRRVLEEHLYTCNSEQGNTTYQYSADAGGEKSAGPPQYSANKNLMELLYGDSGLHPGSKSGKREKHTSYKQFLGSLNVFGGGGGASSGEVLGGGASRAAEKTSGFAATTASAFNFMSSTMGRRKPSRAPQTAGAEQPGVVVQQAPASAGMATNTANVNGSGAATTGSGGGTAGSSSGNHAASGGGGNAGASSGPNSGGSSSTSGANRGEQRRTEAGGHPGSSGADGSDPPSSTVSGGGVSAASASAVDRSRLAAAVAGAPSGTQSVKHPSSFSSLLGTAGLSGGPSADPMHTRGALRPAQQNQLQSTEGVVRIGTTCGRTRGTTAAAAHEAGSGGSGARSAERVDHSSLPRLLFGSSKIALWKQLGGVFFTLICEPLENCLLATNFLELLIFELHKHFEVPLGAEIMGKKPTNSPTPGVLEERIVSKPDEVLMILHYLLPGGQLHFLTHPLYGFLRQNIAEALNT